MTPAMLKRLGAFQMRGLRYIFKIEHSYHSKVSNIQVFDKINIILNRGSDIEISWQEFLTANRYDEPQTISKLFDYAMYQQNKLLGHLIRADPLDLMRQPTMNNTLPVPGIFEKRAGRPRLNWVEDSCKWAQNKQLNQV